MNHQSATSRTNRPNGFIVRHVLHFALFAAFSLWVLYQIRQPTGNSGVGSQLSNDRASNFLGRKGSAGLSKSTLNPHLGLTLADVTNPGEEGEIPQYSKEIEAVEFHSKSGSLEEGNHNNALLGDGLLTLTKSNISFPDENGIPQHVRDKFIGTESKNSVNKTRVQSQSQSMIATRVGRNRRRGSVEES